MTAQVFRSEWGSGGWFAGAVRRSSPNCDLRPPGCGVCLALIHSISLPPGRYGGGEVERLFANRLDWNEDAYFQSIRGLKVSAHFLIRRSGELLQFVGCDQRAWHAGSSVWRGCENCNDYSVGIELEGTEGESFEPAQYQRLSELLHALARRYPITGLAGHEHVAPGRKYDPGAGFNWPQLAAQLNWPAQYFPEGVISRADVADGSQVPASRPQGC